MEEFDALVQIVARLRGEGGCPWDRAQTPTTMRPYLLEEAYEVLDAVDRDDASDLRKELGDLLFQVVMLSRMAEEQGDFDLGQVLRGINQKMIRRHPHVFEPDHGNGQEQGSIAAWEQRKARERDPDRSILDGVPQSLPALLRAHRISEKASGVGFDWPDAAGVRAKLDEELAEFDEAVATGDPAAVGEELGDVLFTLVNLGRHLPVGAEEALRVATARFEARFRRLEVAVREAGLRIHEVDVYDLEPMWREAKESR